MADDKTIIDDPNRTVTLSPLPAIVLEPETHASTKRTGEWTPIGEIDNRHLARQISELRKIIEEGQKATIATIQQRLGGLTTTVDEHDDRLDSHQHALGDHELQIGKLDKRVTKLETERIVSSLDVPPTLPRQPVAVPATPTPTNIDERVGAFVARHRSPSPQYLRLAAGGLAWLALAALIVTLIVVGISRSL